MLLQGAQVLHKLAQGISAGYMISHNWSEGDTFKSTDKKSTETTVSTAYSIDVKTIIATHVLKREKKN